MSGKGNILFDQREIKTKNKDPVHSSTLLHLNFPLLRHWHSLFAATWDGYQKLIFFKYRLFSSNIYSSKTNPINTCTLILYPTFSAIDTSNYWINNLNQWIEFISWITEFENVDASLLLWVWEWNVHGGEVKWQSLTLTTSLLYRFTKWDLSLCFWTPHWNYLV